MMSWIRKNKLYLLIYLILQIVYLLFFPENRIETDDGYWYAFLIRDYSIPELFNPRFLLFLPFMKTGYELIRGLGFVIDSYQYLCYVNSIIASASGVLFFYFLEKILKFDKALALVTTAFLCFSYSYWRYAVESELYAMTWLLSIGFLIILGRYLKKPELKYEVAMILIGSFAVLWYKPNIIPFYIAFQIAFLVTKKYKWILYYSGISGILILLGFFLSYVLMKDAPASFAEHLLGGGAVSHGSFLTAGFVIVSNQISINWIYAFNEVVEFIQKVFPHKVIEEEIYMGTFLGATKFLSLVSIGSLIILSPIFLYFGIFKKSEKYNHEGIWIKVVWAWVIVYGLILLMLDPSSNEPWLVLQIPFMILLSVYFFRPVLLRKKIILYAFLGAWVLHNLWGGLLVIRNHQSDYYAYKSNWLVENATKEDLILAIGPTSYVRYLRYYTPAQVINLEETIDRSLTTINEQANNPGRVLISNEVLDIPEAIAMRSPGIPDKIEKYIISTFEIEEAGEKDGLVTYQFKKVSSQ